MTPGEGSRAGAAPLVLLAALASAPALAVLPVFDAGRPVATLYREPKLAVAQVLLWALLAAAAWRRPPLCPAAELRRVLGRTPVLLLMAFVAWGAVTALWVEVPANLGYELVQYAPLAALLALLVGWGERDPRVAGVIARGLAASLGLATLIGFLQLAAPLPWLPPIDPQYGVANPSLLGYKNPMALALLGQVYLVAGLAAGGAPRWRPLWGLLLAAEVVYLATLQSRTAYAALAGSALLLAAAAAVRPGVSARRRALVLAGALALGALFAAAVALHPGARARLASAARHAANPAEYLASDRGAYLRNTLHMVRHRPYGVGLGDWQTWYPLFRRYDRYRSFSETVQVRRAHGDLVQLLGETGWSGLALWLGFLAAATAAALRRWLRHGDLRGLFAGVQLAALVIAMGSDYLVEMPYHKLQLFLVAALALIRPLGAGGPGTGERPGPVREPAPAGRRAAAAAAAAVTLAAVAAAGWSVSTLVRSVHAAALERGYLALVAGPEPAAALPRAELERLAGTGERLLRWPGHTKTLYRDLLILAHVEALRGEPARAAALARRGLALHPHSPNGLGLLAELLEDCDPGRSGLPPRPRVRPARGAGRPAPGAAGGRASTRLPLMLYCRN